MILIRPARIVNNEFADGGPDYAVVEITEEHLKRYAHLVFLLEKEDVMEIRDYTSMEYFAGYPEDHTDDTEALRTACDRVVLYKRGYIFWACTEKHSNVEYEADGIYLKDLQELFKVSESKLEDLPLLINDLESEEAKALLKKRLSNPQEEQNA